MVGKIKEMTMRYLIVLFLILAFVVGCGCSNVLVPPAFAANAKDIWPALYGVAANGADEGHFIVYDQLAGAWQAPRLIANDLLALQWTPQRNSIGWFGGVVGTTGGTYNASFIEDTSNDLEIWNSPDDGWQDDAGAWGLLDDDAAEDWLAVDVETRQNYVWAALYYEPIAGANVLYEIDLAAGVPALTASFLTPAVQISDNPQYSIVLDRNLIGCIHFANIDTGIHHCPATPDGIWDKVDTLLTGDYPQIITDEEQRLWILYTTSNNLVYIQAFDDAQGTHWQTAGQTIYTATALDDDYHATWLKMDDTIHLVLVDFNALGNTILVYMRRTPNGWVEQETLLTVDSTAILFHSLVWPQITVDKFGNIFIYYIYIDNWGTDTGGDLQGFYLDVDDYNNPIAASWTAHTNIDQSADLVKWVVAPDSVPISMEM